MNGQRNDQRVDAFRAAGVVVMAIVVIFGLLGYGVWKIKDLKQLDDAVKLPLLVIAGLVSLIALLAVMAIAFKTVHLADQTQALGLPDGTVRAVIALSLILIFAVVTVYLFSDLSDPDNVSSQELADMKTQIARLQAPTTTDTTGTQASTALSPTDTRRASKLAASQDFAKQLLIMLGTLITSITSFYFGSKTATDSTTRPAPSTTPKLTGVDKASILREYLPMSVTAQGSGLSQAQKVTLRNTARAEVGTSGFSSTDTTVHFTVDTGTDAGKWDIVVKMSDGSEATLPGAITIIT